MRQNLQKLGRALVLVALGSTLAMAEAPAANLGFGSALNLRAASATGAAQDNLCKRYMGMGLELNYTAAWGTVSAEVSYFDKPGQMTGSDVSQITLAPGASAINPVKSADVRRSSMENLALRLSYQRVINADWSWQAGAQLANMKYRLEYMAEVTDANGAHKATYDDTYNGTPTNSAFSFSPFVGVSYKVNEASSLQLNVVLLGYTAMDYHHVAGSALGSTQGGNIAMDTTSTQKRTQAHIEIGYAFHF